MREAAVRALANNPSPKATGKLTAKLSDANGSAKVGLLNALGYRGDKAAVDAITKELTSNEATAIAAARALGRIPSLDAYGALFDARANTIGALHKAVVEAMLVHADRLRKSGEEDEYLLAKQIYKMLNRPDELRPVRLAAMRGVIQTAGDKAGELVLEILAGDDTAGGGERGDRTDRVAIGRRGENARREPRQVARTEPRASSPPSPRAATARSYPPCSPPRRVPTPTSSARGCSPLGRLGDASTIEFLLDVMSGTDALAGIAAESLAQLPAEGVDEKLVAVLAREKTAPRVWWL